MITKYEAKEKKKKEEKDEKDEKQKKRDSKHWATQYTWNWISFDQMVNAFAICLFSFFRCLSCSFSTKLNRKQIASKTNKDNQGGEKTWWIIGANHENHIVEKERWTESESHGAWIALLCLNENVLQIQHSCIMMMHWVVVNSFTHSHGIINDS